MKSMSSTKKPGVALAMALATALACGAPASAPEGDTRTGTSLVKTAADAEGVCAGVVISSAVSKYMEMAANAGKAVASQEEALRRLSADPAWKTKVEPAVQATCHCV